ncbi:MAG TPA: LuxR C-terminal-related transcriptional regulator, partial [Solirubrobacteraceae bacterium]|nr:LuxR C-terminal-related transcriptional regulator [Solirubrobacteraceae bacterium]
LGLSVRAIAAGATTMLATYRSHLPAPATATSPELTSREQRVLALVADGLPTREIGEELHYSERTVKKVLGDVVVKLGARSRSQAIARAVRQGII